MLVKSRSPERLHAWTRATDSMTSSRVIPKYQTNRMASGNCCHQVGKDLTEVLGVDKQNSVNGGINCAVRRFLEQMRDCEDLRRVNSTGCLMGEYLCNERDLRHQPYEDDKEANEG